MFGLREAQFGNSDRAMTRDPDVPAAFRGSDKVAPKPASTGMRPSPQHGQKKSADRPGIDMSGDSVTGEALMRALQAVRSKDDDLMDWVDECISALRIATRDPVLHAKLPRFEDTPSLDSFNDDDGGSDEDY